MSRLLTIEDTTENKISYYLIAAFLILLPFERFYSQLILASFIIHTLIHLNRQKLRSVFTVKTLVVSSVFFIGMAGLLYSEDKTQAIKDLQRQSAIILIPLFLPLTNIDLKKYKKRWLLLFSFSCVFAILYLYIDAIRIIFYNNLSPSWLFTKYFMNHNFSGPIDMHATYLSIYVLVSSVVLFHSLRNEINKRKRIIYSLSLAVLFAGLIQLGSKSVLISAIIIALSFPFILLKGNKRLSIILLILLVTGVGFFTIINVDSFKRRYIEQFKADLTQVLGDSEVPEPRIIRWYYILGLVRQSPLYGHGSGSEKRLLNQVYYENKLYISYLHELNAHNQYLSTLLKTGVLGLLVFLLSIFVGFAIAIRNKDILFTGFMIVISIVGFSENLLDVNKGIFFYGFFFTFFIHTGKPFEGLTRSEGKQEHFPGSTPTNKSSHAVTFSRDNYL